MDEPISAKVAHVKRAKAKGETRGHACHWPGCEKSVPPAMWGCTPHWFALPKRLRDRIWATYRRGQEDTKTPSREYLEVATEVQIWIREQIVRKQAEARNQNPKFHVDNKEK
jgi:hypothetical protein